MAARKKCVREKKRREGKGRGVNFSPLPFLNVWEKLVMQEEDPSKSLQSPPNKGKGPNFVFYSMANEWLAIIPLWGFVICLTSLTQLVLGKKVKILFLQNISEKVVSDFFLISDQYFWK